jgi:hypothetical protein
VRALVLAEIAKLRASVAMLAADQIELREDVRALQAVQPAKDGGAPAGMVPLKAATKFADGYSIETVRLWAAAHYVKAQRPGARWFLDVASLTAHVAAKRKGAA